MNIASLESKNMIQQVSTSNTIKLGIYRHYKGDYYKVIGVARHSETLEEMVVYQGMHYSHEFGNGPLWVRPATMFIEMLEFKGALVQRFDFVGV